MILFIQQPHDPIYSCCSVVSSSLQPHGLQHARLPCPSLFPEFAQSRVHILYNGVHGVTKSWTRLSDWTELILYKLLFFIQHHLKLFAQVQAAFVYLLFLPFSLCPQFLYSLHSLYFQIHPFPFWRIILFSTDGNLALVCQRNMENSSQIFSLALNLNPWGKKKKKGSLQLIVYIGPWERVMDRLVLRVYFRSHLSWLGGQEGWTKWGGKPQTWPAGALQRIQMSPFCR